MKSAMIRVVLRLVGWLPGEGGPLRRRLSRRLALAHLARTDIFRYRVERLRESGAVVGTNCRLFPVNIFSEPNLVSIGDNVIISGRVVLLTHDGALHPFADRIPNLNGHYGRITIGNNCFIGFGATIMPNVSIGANCIVAAGAVVFDSFPDDSVIIGNPAKVAFKTPLYLAMKRNHPNTITDERFPFPAECPPELLDERIGPARPPRMRGPRPERETEQAGEG